MWREFHTILDYIKRGDVKMNTRSKTSFVMLAIVTVVSVLLSSCAQAKPTAAPTTAPVQPATSAPATSAPVATTAPPAELVTLQVWAFDDEIIKFATPKFEQLHPNIKIELLTIPSSDFTAKVDTAIAANQVPDIVGIPSRNEIQAGHIMDLDPFLAQEGWSLDSFPASIMAAPENGGVLNGKLYVMPTNMFVWAMIINKDLFKAAGLPELTSSSVITYDDWLTYARAINKPSKDLATRVWGSAYMFPTWNSMNNYMSDPFIIGADGKKCTGNSADWQHFFEIQKTAFDEQLTLESSSSLAGENDAFGLFTQGKLGMMYASQSELIAAVKKGMNVAFVGQPVVTKGWTHNTGFYIVGYSMMAKSAHPAEAWEFLKYLLTDASMEVALADTEDYNGVLPALKTTAAKWVTMLSPQISDALSVTPILLDRAAVPPFTPDIWGSEAPYDEAFTAITQQGVDVKTALDTATANCQQLTDEAWVTWNSFK
jgi:multiple sugar transport system substrate-binding protein